MDSSARSPKPGSRNRASCTAAPSWLPGPCRRVDPFQVVGRQRVVTRQLSIIDRKFEQSAPFVTREQASARHGCLRRVWGGSNSLKTETAKRRHRRWRGRGEHFSCLISWFGAQSL